MTALVDALITATSLSCWSQVMKLVQLRPLPSSHWLVAVFLRTIWPTRGAVPLVPLLAGLNVVPEFGGGFTPAYGPFAGLTVAKGREVVWFPDSKMAR